MKNDQNNIGGTEKAAQKRRANRLAGDPISYMRQIQGWLSDEEADHLYGLAAECRNGCIVEVGAYRGKSTTALGLGSLSGGRAKVYAVDPHDFFLGTNGKEFGPKDRKAFMKNLVMTEAYNVVALINLSSEVICQGWKEPVGLLWIDGDHSYEGVARDWACWSLHLLPDATVVFDDAISKRLGPSRLIKEILESDGSWQVIKTIGKTVTIRR